MKLGQVISVTSSKKGVGATFFVSNLAGALSEEGKKIVILDFNENLNILNFFGFDKFNDLSKVLNKEISLQSAKNIYQDNRNITIISSKEKITLNESFISDIFKQIKKTYDYILIDLPSNFNEANLKLIKKYINKNVIVVEPELSSIKEVNKKKFDNIENAILINKFDFSMENQSGLLISIEDMYSTIEIDYLGIIEKTVEEHLQKPSFLTPYSNLNMAFNRIAKRIIKEQYLNKISNIEYTPDFSMEILFKVFDISKKL